MSKHLAEPELDYLGPLFQRPLDGGGCLEGSEEKLPAEETKGLGRQLADVFEAIQDGQAYTLNQLESMTGHSQASISAQLRNLRRPSFGAFIVERCHKGRGLYLYRLALRPDGTPARAGSSRSQKGEEDDDEKAR